MKIIEIKIDDMDDFIERDDEKDRFVKSNEYTGNSSIMNNQNKNLNVYDSNLDSYKVAVDIFGDDFDINDFNFKKPFIDEIENQDNIIDEYVSDDNEIDVYSDDETKIINKHNIVSKSLYDLYEPEELKRQFLTEKDDEICLIDIPERFQTRFNKVEKADDEELDEEAQWIFENFFLKKPILLTTEKRYNINSNIDHSSENIKYIKVALNLIRNELCEIPFILTYRHEYISGVFNEDELWLIYRADNKWMSFSKKLKDYNLYLNKFKNFQIDLQSKYDFYYKITDRDLKYLNKIQSDQEFYDFNKKIKLYNDLYEVEYKNYINDEMANKNESENINNHKDPNIFNRHNFFISKGIDKVLKSIGFKSSDFDENVRVQYRKYNFECPNELPDDFAKRYVSPNYPTSENILDACFEMYMIEISNEQHVKRYVRDVFFKNARLNVRPTKKGLNEIDETHSYCSFKYIVNKPLKTVSSEMFIKLNQAKIDDLLIVEIILLDSVKNEILDYLKSFQNIVDKCIYYKEWNDLCFKAIDKAILNFIIPSLTKELYEKLLNEAYTDLVSKCAKIFKNHLISSPFSRELENMRLDQKNDFGESDLPCILVISVPMINYNQQNNKVHQHQMKSVKGNINAHFIPFKNSNYRNTNIDNIETNDNEIDEITVGTNVEEIGYGIVMNSEYEVLEHITLNNCILKNMNENYSKLSLKKIEKLVCKYNISDIFIPLLGREYNYLSENIEKYLIDTNIDKQIQVHVINPYISNKVVLMMSSKQNWSLLKVEYEKALSYGRYILDPLIECVYLFSNDKELLFMNDLLQPYQKFLNVEKLVEAFEEKIILMVNETGIDLNKVCHINQYAHLLQYVCGLGTRKANKIINDIRAYSDSLKLNNRTQLVTICNLGPKVFINCAGFLKIVGSVEEEGDIDLLDSTRIHPELYDWTRKIMVDALEIDHINIDPTKKYDYNDLLETLRSDSSKLRELDLDAFAEELVKSGTLVNKKYTLELISTEMLAEFPDYRPRFCKLGYNEKFWILLNGGSRIDISDTIEYATLSSKTNNINMDLNSDFSRFHNEDLVPIYNGKLVSFIVTNFICKRPDREDITKAVPIKDEETQLWKCPFCIELISHDLKKCWVHIETDCPGRSIGVRGIIEGFYSIIPGVIAIVNISDNPPHNMKERVKKGMHLTCQVLNITYEKYSAELTCKSSDLLDKKNQCYKFKRDTHFDFEAEDEQRMIVKKNIEKLKNQVLYMKKIIIHPSFKNISFSEAEEILKLAEIGECIIRPSSKGSDHLTVTWKVCDNIYQHIDVIEQDKPNQFSLGKKLWIKNECYDDLDEIIARHISPMIILVKEASNLKVFNYADGGSRHKIAAILSEEKKSNPMRIPYIFSPCKIYPGKFLLGFLPRNTPIFEYVSITPEGVKFRDIVHNSFQDLILWFKKNFSQNASQTPKAFISSPNSFQKYGTGLEFSKFK